ncbi:MAG: glycosyltransferase family 2 protein [Lachnospiraceae bacterium]|nr:glycosyltransferase family 2 protein [Lachnospiraceae bacterium]
MRLSIIVPVYNMASDGKLRFCLDSLVTQTISDYEIIAVDDGSTDDSPAILGEYQEKYPDKFKVIYHEKNKRQGGAKNTGLKVAAGQWVGFIDSDDWVTPDYYEKLLTKAEQTGADMVGCDYTLVTEHTMVPGQKVQNNTADQTGALDEEKHKKLILRSGSMVLKIYKREVITQNRLDFPEGIFYEDNCAGPLWSFYFNHFERVEEFNYFYYQHAVSTVHHVTESKCLDRMKAANLFYEECAQRGFLEKYFEEIEYRYTELHFVNTLFSYMLGAKKKKLSFVRRLKTEITQHFPKFQENPYYQKLTNEEEKRMIEKMMKSTVYFFYYYRMLTMYRRWRKGTK